MRTEPLEREVSTVGLPALHFLRDYLRFEMDVTGKCSFIYYEMEYHILLEFEKII
jgi:hypothetical protein